MRGGGHPSVQFSPSVSDGPVSSIIFLRPTPSLGSLPFLWDYKYISPSFGSLIPSPASGSPFTYILSASSLQISVHSL